MAGPGGPPPAPATSAPAPPGETGPAPSADAIAEIWLAAVEGSCFVLTSRAELLARLTEHARTLLAAVRTDPPGTVSAREVGRWMVRAHFTNPESLDQSIRTLATPLTAVGPQASGAVLGALSAGYAAALQELTGAEQERVRSAAFSARVAAQEARRTRETRFPAIFADATMGIAIIDLNGEIVEVNRALCEMFGLSRHEFTRRNVFDYIPADDELWTQLRRMREGSLGHLRLERSYRRSDGTTIWTDVVLSLGRAHDGSPRYIVGMVADVTPRRRLETSLRRQAHHDPLTGLPNRTLFFERLESALAMPAAEHDVGVCYLDLDGFKAVNDTLGHDVGDQLLQALAQRLATQLHGPGHLVARMGGDEFAVLVEHPSGGDPAAARDELRRLAQRALDAVRRPIVLGRHRIVVSASIGVVERGDGGSGSAELMKAADTTLYWAKNDGRNRVALFDADRHRADVARFELSARMPGALEGGEFVVDYQPLVRLADQRLVGVEALVRWQQPRGERLGPDQFIPVAEETGLIVPLGRWVLEEACRQAVEWRAEGADLFISVNLAARQVREPGIVADVARILADTGWPAQALQLELTESDLLSTTGEPLDALRALADMGVRIAIDDFGTGYSNLAYLRSLPVHALKLAGPFMTGRNSPAADGGDGTDEVDHEVLALLIELAHKLGLSVTAEVVETSVQLEWLRKLGCDTGQGWYFAPAVSAGAVSHLLHGPIGPP